MRFRAALLIPLAFAGMDPATTSPDTGGSSSRESLHGVVKGPDGKPVAKAHVRVWPNNNGAPTVATETDGTGGFRISPAAHCPCLLRVDAPGFARASVYPVETGHALSVVLNRGVTLEGTVKNALTGRPIAGARVEVYDWRRQPGTPAHAVRSDVRGRFRMETVPPDTWLTAMAPGYARTTTIQARRGTPLAFSLFPGGDIAGLVLGGDDRPVVEALVAVDSEDFDSQLRKPNPVVTDAAGHFEVPSLPVGRYRVVALRKGLRPAVETGVTVEPRGRTELKLHLRTGGVLVGRLLDSKQQPVQGHVTVDLRELGLPRDSDGEVDSDAQGRFRLEGLPAGTQVLRAKAAGFASRAVDVQVFETDSVVDAGDVVLEAGLTIRGHVRETGGDALAAATLEASFGGSALSEAQSGADGSFELPDLAPGSYLVNASAPGHVSVEQSMRAGTKGAELSLAVGGAITGLIVDESGQPVAGFGAVQARCVASQAPSGHCASSEKQWSHGSPGPDGRFTLTGLVADTYLIEARVRGYALATVPAVELRAGETVDVGQVQLSAGGTIRGTVKDADGSPIAGARVFMVPALMIEDEVQTDGSGAFELVGLPKGMITVHAQHPDFVTAEVAEVPVDAAHGPAKADFVMVRGGRIEGSARTRLGLPVTAASVYVRTVDRKGPSVFARLQADGTFVVEHAPIGPIHVELWVSGGTSSAVNLTKDVELVAGQTTTVDFRPREVLVSGRVTRGGSAAARLRVAAGSFASYDASRPARNLVDGASGRRFEALTDADGRYALTVEAPGQAYLVVSEPDGSQSYGGQTVVVPDEESFTTDLDLPAMTFSGRVVDASSGEPIPEARVTLQDRVATSGPDGRVRLATEAGAHGIAVEAKDHVPARLEVNVAEGSDELRIPLEPGATLTGRVLDRQNRPPSERGDIYAWESGSELFAEHTPLDSDGRFSFTRTAAGIFYDLVYCPRGDFVAWATHVPADARGIVLHDRSTGPVRVTLLGANGQPAAGAWVYLSAVGDDRVLCNGGKKTDAQGVVELALPAGELTLGVLGVLPQRTAVALTLAEGVTRATVKLPGDARSLNMRLHRP